jgi:hypothetical protein
LAQFHLGKIISVGSNQERLRVIQLVFESTGIKQSTTRSEVILNIYDQIFNDNRQITVEQHSQITEFMKYRHQIADSTVNAENVESTPPA